MKQFTNPELEHLRTLVRDFFYYYNNNSEEDVAILEELLDEALICAEILGVHPDPEDSDDGY